MLLWKYSKIFGEPNKGVHSVRLFNIALIDALGTVIGIYLVHKYIERKFKRKIPYVHIVVPVVVIFIFVHFLFGVNTTINTFLFGRINITAE